MNDACFAWFILRLLGCLLCLLSLKVQGVNDACFAWFIKNFWNLVD